MVSVDVNTTFTYLLPSPKRGGGGRERERERERTNRSRVVIYTTVTAAWTPEQKTYIRAAIGCGEKKSGQVKAWYGR